MFGYDDAPHGHAEVLLENVRVPASNMLLGEGRGFEIAQGRLGPGRIHHCMRSIGVAERALELMCKRLTARVAFGKPIAEQSVWHERIAESRCMIDQARLLVLNAAYMMDTVGNKVARKRNRDDQGRRAEHDAAGDRLGDPGARRRRRDVGLSARAAVGRQRTLRIADGPDEVHRNAIAKLELAKYLGKSADDVAMPVTRGG